jgi:hypothetical protein
MRLPGGGPARGTLRDPMKAHGFRCWRAPRGRHTRPSVATPVCRHPARSLRLSMVAMFGHAGAVEALVAAGVPRVIAHVFVVHLHALSDHA